ncbi:methyl-accepting chemotaxis sensory transducer with GAF sensor [Calothrix parasitica NIES-267]|uniref:Methyl-accepting chemotaxis sensory transducer with GAF sensor n=1 Tax=Calothrix parasitica NIES-267 TaxID=1973488 RepID=A0A1Z4LLU1_9CYAN|nr:methyl-accepting chemotaxis sensory transducer with GAF sensor [Calothrix parasitica NIES-267]
MMKKLNKSQIQKKNRYSKSEFSNFPRNINNQSKKLQNSFLTQMISQLKNINLNGKTVMLSLAICSLPTIGITALSYHLGNQIISVEVTEDTDTNTLQQLEASQKQLLLMLQIGTLAAVLVAAISTAAIARRLVLPIYAANLAVKKLANGNLNSRIPIKGKDEFADLSNNVNLIVEQLQELLFEERVESEQAKLLSDTIIAISQSVNTEDLFNRTVKEVRQVLGAHRVVIYHCNSDGEGQVIAEEIAPGLPITFGETIEDVSLAKELTEIYTQSEVLAINNVDEAGLSSEHLELMKSLRIKAILLTPIFKDNKIFGFLIAHHCWNPHLWQAFEINLIKQLAIQAGLTLEQVTNTEKREAIQELAIKLSGCVDNQDICTVAVENIRKSLKVEKTLIYQLDGKLDSSGRGSLIAESGVTDLDSSLSKNLDFPDLAVTSGVIAINDINHSGLPQSTVQQLKALNIKASLIVPLKQNEELFGYLIAYNYSQTNLWQQSEIQLFDESAGIVGEALQRINNLFAAKQLSQEQLQQEAVLKQQIVQLIENIEAVSSGDLTVRAEVTSGEIGTVADFINSIIENLREIVTQVKLTATEVNSAIANDESAINQLSINASEQALEVNRTLEAVREMRSSIKSIAKGARKAATVASKASMTAESGGAAMDLTVENIHCLRETIGDTSKKVKLLGESSQKISHVVSLINQIAMKTNLLAINAGIEATKAGEEGEGFAVVAEEVAALANRSSDATAEIEGIVAGIQRETSEVVKAMELGITQVVEETRLIEDTKQNLNEILNVSHQIDGLVESISAATVIQVKTSKQVSNLMKEIAKISEETGNSTHEISTSLQKTVDISKKLAASVDTFTVS